MADTKKMLICPACGKEMKKIYIEGVDINIDICTDGCGGILFDNRELEKVSDEYENAEVIMKELGGKKFEPADESKHRVCPVCNTIMVKNGAANGKVSIDVCNVCGAKFLDYGELEKIRESFNEEYKETVKNKYIFDSLNQQTARETLGFFGMFINDNFKETGARKHVENFIKKII